MRNNNLSMLFSNMTKNNSIDYSAYSAIKNGSYKKLLKAHYANEKETVSANSKNDTANKTNKVNGYTDTTASGKLSKEAKELRETINKLSQADMWKDGADKNKIIDSVKQFAGDYNDVLANASNVKSSDVSKSTNWMTSLTGVMSNTLNRAGIHVGADGKLTVDEDKMKNADLTTIKSLFVGNHSYADEISQDAASIANAAAKSTSLYGANGKLYSPVASFFDQTF